MQDCYLLAYIYHLDPRVFLEMGFSELNQHIANTAEMQRRRMKQQQQREQEQEDIY